MTPLLERIINYVEMAKLREVTLDKILVHPDEYSEAVELGLDLPIQSMSTSVVHRPRGEPMYKMVTYRHSVEGTVTHKVILGIIDESA